MAGISRFRGVPRDSAFPSRRAMLNVREYAVDCDRVRDRCGWEPRVSLEQGLEMTLDFYRERMV